MKIFLYLELSSESNHNIAPYLTRTLSSQCITTYWYTGGECTSRVTLTWCTARSTESHVAIYTFVTFLTSYPLFTLTYTCSQVTLEICWTSHITTTWLYVMEKKWLAMLMIMLIILIIITLLLLLNKHTCTHAFTHNSCVNK